MEGGDHGLIDVT